MYNPMDNSANRMKTDNSKMIRRAYFFSLVTFIISLIAGFQMGISFAKTGSIMLPLNSLSPSPTLLPTASPTIYNPNTFWKTAKFGTLSYEYPSGWHVAEIWGVSDTENIITIVIDPNPISTQPRGDGPWGIFTIDIANGLSEPISYLNKKINNYNETEYFDIQKETIKSDFGEVYYFKGKLAGDFMKGSSIENYIFTLNQNPDDPLNQQVITAQLFFRDDSALSEMLRHIALSFKEL